MSITGVVELERKLTVFRNSARLCHSRDLVTVGKAGIGFGLSLYLSTNRPRQIRFGIFQRILVIIQILEIMLHLITGFCRLERCGIGQVAVDGRIICRKSRGPLIERKVVAIRCRLGGGNIIIIPLGSSEHRIGGRTIQSAVAVCLEFNSIRRLLHGRRFIKQGFCFAACFILIDETCLLAVGRLVGGIVLRAGFPCGVGIRLDGDRDDQFCTGVSAVCVFGNSIGLIVKSSNIDLFAISNGNINAAGSNCIFPTLAVACDIGLLDRNAGVFGSLRSIQFKVAGQGIAQYRICANVQLKAGNLLADALENFI